MTVSTILDHIDSGHMALHKFQRGNAGNRDRLHARPVPGRFRAILQQAMEAA